MKITKRYMAVVVAAIFGVVALVCTRQRPQRWLDNSGVVWTTDYHISYLSSVDLRDSIQAVLQAVDRSASVYNRSSLVSRFNAGQSVGADAILDTLYRASVMVHGQSEGAFDPTVMPLVNAWGFGYKSGAMPTEGQIDSILAFVGLDKVGLVGGRLVKRDPRVQLDFSSIAKIGGEIACAGRNRQDLPWHVSVDLPSDQPDSVSHEAALVLAVDNGGVATSGNYRKYRESGGQRISHIVDPKTGRSESSTLLSVTIVAPSCMLADAWATACMVLGTERVVQLMEGRDDLGVMTITAGPEGQLVVWSNARFARLVAQ